eukprot:1464508-Pleurochrysis_carterae.AAC.1
MASTTAGPLPCSIPASLADTEISTTFLADDGAAMCFLSMAAGRIFLLPNCQLCSFTSMNRLKYAFAPSSRNVLGVSKDFIDAD